ncbi:MAG: exo-alpha-sialidase, partial [Clostridia bacterium]|nr:exo-alpha-sialidase [Clostridia bacterium]
TDSFVVELTRGMVNASEFIKENNFYGDETESLMEELLKELPPRCRVGVGADNEYNRYNPIDRVYCWQTKNKPIQFNFNGKNRIMLPLYCDKFDCSMVGYTDDYGKTWEYSQPISSTGNIQAATVQMNDGTLRSYFRSSVPYETLAYQESKDGGKTWGTCGIEFTMTHEGGFDIVKLKSGKWVMSISENIFDGDKKYPRARLCLSVSKDEGKTWIKTPIEEDVTGASQYHYSAIIEGIDGNIYIVYSHDNLNDSMNRNNIRMTRLELK